MNNIKEKEPDTAGTVTNSKPINNTSKYDNTSCCENCQENNIKQLNKIYSMLNIFTEPEASRENLLIAGNFVRGYVYNMIGNTESAGERNA